MNQKPESDMDFGARPAEPTSFDAALSRGKKLAYEARVQRMADLTEGDIEVDPELLELGDEVADEVVNDFKGFAANPSKFSAEEQRMWAQKAADLAYEKKISVTAAQTEVAAKAGVHWSALRRWTDDHGVESLIPKKLIRPDQSVVWDVYRREELLGDIMANAKLLLERQNVWLQYNPKNPLFADVTPPPEGWNAASDLKSIAVTVAIAHDKLTHIEVLKQDRGLIEADSEELRGGLDAGRQRLIDMGGR